MMSHNVHHYVPVFLLKEWQSGPDDKLSCFRWAPGRLLAKRYKAKSVAKLQGLYTLAGRKPGYENVVERDYLGPAVDSPAAAAHRIILEQGVRALNAQSRTDWSRFLVSLLLRTPGQVEKIRRVGRESLAAELEKSPEEYAKVRGDDPAETLMEWVEQNLPATLDDMGIQTLPTLVESKLLNRAIFEANWATRSLPPDCVDLLISDTPLVYLGTMARAFSLCLPVSPNRVFFAFNHPQTSQYLSYCSDASVAKLVNRHTLDVAVQYVYGKDDRQRGFIERYLRKPR